MAQPVMPVRPHEVPQPESPRNQRRFSTRVLVASALLCAIGVLLSLVEFPLLPGVTWLKFDASAMPALVGGFAYGPAAGVSIGVVGAIIHGLLFADFSGAVMNILVVVAFVLPAAAIYRARPTFAFEMVGLAIGAVCMVAFAILGNLVITPAWLGVPLDAVIAMILPVLLPFNALKAVINAALAAAVYNAVAALANPDGKPGKAERP